MDGTRGGGRSDDATTQWRGSVPPPSDADGFAATFHDHAPALYDFLARLSGRPDAADALVRQVAAQAAMGAASAGQWPTPRAWLFSRAVAALPADSKPAAADPGPFIAIARDRLPPSPDTSGVDDMGRAIWRAVSALPLDQHALLHLHIRAAMVAGEAASALGITEREAVERIRRLLPAVESAARALYLIRSGRGRDPGLDALLRDLNAARLTPEARAKIEAYAASSPTVQALLAEVPPPLAVYAALRPLAIPGVLADDAVAAAVPWLAADAPTQTLPATDATTTLPPGGYGAEMSTTVNPVMPPDQYSYGGYEPPTQEAFDGTLALDIPVRQRVVQEEAYTPPVAPARRPVAPLALLGLLGGALVLIVGALVLFLVKGDGATTTNARVTATVGGTATTNPTVTPTPQPSALLTATALAAVPIPTLAPTPTALPVPTVTASPPPLPPRTTTGSAVASLPPLGTSGVEPRVTSIPNETPTPRVTPIPTPVVSTLAPTMSAPLPVATSVPAPTARVTATTAMPTAAATVRATTAPSPSPAAATTAATTTTATRTATGTAGAAIPTMMATRAPMTNQVTANKASLMLSGTKEMDTVTLANGTTMSAMYSASSDSFWLLVSPASGTIAAGQTAPLTFTINPAGLMKGNYTGVVTVTTPTGPQTITVALAL